MSDMRQVLQEAETALEPFARLAELKDRNDFVPEPDGNAWTFSIYGDLTVGDLRRARSTLALIRASLAEGDEEKPSYPPCRKCGRKVKHPCNDAEGYHTEGPWDTFCRDYFYPSER